MSLANDESNQGSSADILDHDDRAYGNSEVVIDSDLSNTDTQGT